jgi:uncharacterized protein YdeI (YjbR/CyaY-like superfamily)
LPFHWILQGLWHAQAVQLTESKLPRKRQLFIALFVTVIENAFESVSQKKKFILKFIQNKLIAENTLNIKTRAEWRNWLQRNFNIEREAWLIYPKKSSGEQRIQYNDAVEEALCFGWIDSTCKTLDKDHNMQRFTPRKARSTYSQANKERLKFLAENNLIHHLFLDKVREIISKEYVCPADIIDEIKKDKTAWNNYLKFSGPYQRIRIAYIDSARKRPEEFAKRLTNFIQKTRANKLIAGFGGIDKYY